MPQDTSLLKNQKLWAGFLFLLGLLLLILCDDTVFFIVSIPIMSLASFWFLRCIENIRQKSLHYTWTAILSGTYSLVFLIWLTLPFYSLPKGTEIRPMVYIACLDILGTISIIFGLIFTVFGQIKNKRWFFNIFAFWYCWSVHWIIDWMWAHAVHVRELILSP